MEDGKDEYGRFVELTLILGPYNADTFTNDLASDLKSRLYSGESTV